MPGVQLTFASLPTSRRRLERCNQMWNKAADIGTGDYMQNEIIGSSSLFDGRAVRTTELSEVGYPLWGPYVFKTAGVYQVEFQLAVSSCVSESDVACATLEITADNGRTKLAERPVLMRELERDFCTFTLIAATYHLHVLEFRVKAHGTAALIIDAHPRLIRLSAILDKDPNPALGPLAKDLDAFGRDTRRILRSLRPVTLADAKLIRLGRRFDGGYVCIDDFEGIDTAFSFGICDDISWDLAAADRGLTIYQFDHTVSDPAPDDVRLVFEPKMIAAASGDDSQALSDLILKYDKKKSRPNLVLKMDIEGWEWPVIDATSEEDLSRLAWIVCELHDFRHLTEPGHRELIDRCLGKLSRCFGVVHVHSNLWGAYFSLANTVIPGVVEITFANRNIYSFGNEAPLFPTELDDTCDPEQPDFYLGTFAY